MDPAIEGNLGLLRAVAKTPSVKRVVITSSVAAIFGFDNPGMRIKIKKIRKKLIGINFINIDKNHVYDEKDWNPITYDATQAASGPMVEFIAYVGAKKLAEKAAWDFIEKEKPKFGILSILFFSFFSILFYFVIFY